MSRVEIPTTVQSGVYPVTGADVWIYERNSSTQVDVFSAEDGGELLAQPLQSINGRVDGWVEAGQSLDSYVTYGNKSARDPWEAIDANQLVVGAGHVIEDETTPLTPRGKLSFQGPGVTVSDDAANNRSVVSISSGGSAHIILDETTPRANRSKLAFLGTGVTVNDDSLSDTTNVVIPGVTPAHVIQDEGVDLTQRSKLNFVGSLVAVTDDAGNDQTDVTITTPLIPQSVIFAQPGSAVVGPSAKVFAPRALTLTKLRLSCVTAPTGSALTVNVAKNGSTIATLTIAAGSTTTAVATPGAGFTAPTTFAVDDTLTVSTTSVGSTTAATGAAVQADFTG